MFLRNCTNSLLHTIEYWNAVADKSNPEGTREINDNWWKRQQLARNLLEYNFIKKKIIEIGCGLGVTAATIRNAVGLVDYMGIDISPKFCKLAKNLLNLKTKEGSITKIPVNKKQYDYMFLFDVLEHIEPSHRNNAYKEISRVLKDKAKIFINNPITKSGHPDKFDFGFNELDLGIMCEKTKFRLEKSSIIKIKPQQKIYEYQFIVLFRE